MTMEATKVIEDFEGDEVPADWRLAGGSLRLSSRHFKTGRQSLHWTWESGAALRRGGLAVSTAQHPGAGISGWVYCEKPVGGRLTFRLGPKAQLAQGAASYEFRFGLNFTGWRMFMVQFAADARTTAPGGDIEAMEILPPESVPSGEVYLDALTISPNMSGQRSADYQIPEHGEDLGHWCAHWPLHYSRQTPTVPMPSALSSDQKRDFAVLGARYRKWLLGGNPDLSKPILRRGAEQTDSYIREGWEEFRALGIRKDEEGWITGPGLRLGRGPATFHHVFYNVLLPLVFDYKLHANAEAKAPILLLFEYVHDQGWAEGSANGSLWLNPLNFAPYCHAIALMREELKEAGRLDEAMRAALWYLHFGKTFTRFDEGFIETNADALRSVVFTSLVMIISMEDTPQKLQYLRGWQAWFRSALEVSPRFDGMFKPDGTGFHHRGIYVYAYCTIAYDFAALCIWLLHGTEFAVEKKSVATLVAAMKAQEVMSHKFDTPYAAQGRMPGLNIRFLSAHAYLALSSDPPDPEMAGIFMRLWDTDPAYLESTLSMDLDGKDRKFLCLQTLGRLQILQEFADLRLPATPAPEGFWSKPWGGLAIHRRADWMVSVKGWSQYVWDFEMHARHWNAREENVYGRFCSYGTLQPITTGHPPNAVASGWNLNQGWDWCRWPGATSPHMVPEEIYDPSTSWATRFFSTATFVGGVGSGGRNGLFALKLRENFYDPSFFALKTWFFFENEIICLGSNIGTHSAAHPVGTTLFQSWMPDEGMPIRIQGEQISAFPFSYQGAAGQPLTLADPYGNGYFIPDSRDVRLVRAEQKSRDAWNQGETSGAFTTCWLDHGRPPKDDGHGSERYEYAMLVQTTDAGLAAYAKDKPYRVLHQNHQAHILEHLRQKTMAYALFETDWVIPHGIVRKTDTPVMVMVKEQCDGVLLSLADPDLRLPKRRNMAYVDDEAGATTSRPSSVRVELRGQWVASAGEAEIAVARSPDGNTVVAFECREGRTNEITLKPASE